MPTCQLYPRTHAAPTSRRRSPIDGLKTFFKARKKISLEGVSPSDDTFLRAQDSESSIFPPSQEDNEALAMLRESWRGMYDEATTAFSLAEEDVKAMASVR